MFSKTYPHAQKLGVKLDRKKDATLLNWNLKRPLPPEKIRIPIPNKSKPCVGIGDTVEIGQKIADSTDDASLAIYSGSAGKIESIEPLRDGSKTILIKRAGEAGKPPEYEIKKDWDGKSKNEKIKNVFELGVLPLGEINSLRGVKTIVINACEIEPYVTCQRILLMSRPVEILRGAEILREILDAEEILLVFEDEDLETIELIKSKIYFLKWEHIRVEIVPAIYPQGSEKLIKRNVLKNSAENIFFSSSMAFAAYEAVACEKPFFEQVVTVAGECVVEPRSLWLPIGISVSDALRTCKNVMREPGKVLFGGPMQGREVSSLDEIIERGTEAVLALPKENVFQGEENECYKCGRCAAHCPAGLCPSNLSFAADKKNAALLEFWGIRECVECGVCSYVCPAKKNVSGRICDAKELL